MYTRDNIYIHSIKAIVLSFYTWSPIAALPPDYPSVNTLTSPTSPGEPVEARLTLRSLGSQGLGGCGRTTQRKGGGWTGGRAYPGGGGDLVQTMPGCVCPKVKDMGPISASRE